MYVYYVNCDSDTFYMHFFGSNHTSTLVRHVKKGVGVQKYDPKKLSILVLTVSGGWGGCLEPRKYS